jgi:hypothetical protein
VHDRQRGHQGSIARLDRTTPALFICCVGAVFFAVSGCAPSASSLPTPGPTRSRTQAAPGLAPGAPVTTAVGDVRLISAFFLAAAPGQPIYLDATIVNDSAMPLTLDGVTAGPAVAPTTVSVTMAPYNSAILTGLHKLDVGTATATIAPRQVLATVLHFDTEPDLTASIPVQ